jgi:hypothetical protein
MLFVKSADFIKICAKHIETEGKQTFNERQIFVPGVKYKSLETEAPFSIFS